MQKVKMLRDSVKINLYYEWYARFHVQLLNFPFYLCTVKSEKPDFISIGRFVGLEVTRSKPQPWQQLDSIVRKHFGKGYTSSELIMKVEADCKHGFAGSIYDIDGHAAYSPTREAFDTELLTSQVKEAIIRKSGLITTYLKCKVYWLYIFTETSLIDKFSIEDIDSIFQETGSGITFSKIYINTIDHVWVMRKNRVPKAINIPIAFDKIIKFLSREKVGIDISR